MLIRNILVGLILGILAMSCGGPKMIVSNIDNAETAFKGGNYKEAVEAWKLHFNQVSVEEVTGATFARAAQTAFLSGNEDLALKWFDQARYKNFSSGEMYATLAMIYRSKKNISKELSALEYYTNNFNSTQRDYNNRLFGIYYEIDLLDKALEIWERMDADSKNEIGFMKTYFSIQLKLKNEELCDSLSLAVLEKEPDNIEALDWNAKKYYWLGENRYKSELEKYEKNKTRSQYKILLKELELATSDLKKSLVYLEKLWEMDQDKVYASYLASIYGRFGDEKKSNHYQKFVQ